MSCLNDIGAYIQECLYKVNNLSLGLQSIVPQDADVIILNHQIVKVKKIKQELCQIELNSSNAFKKFKEEPKKARDATNNKQLVLLYHNLQNNLKMVNQESSCLELLLADALTLANILTQQITEVNDLVNRLGALNDSLVPVARLPIESLHDHMKCMERTDNNLMEPISMKIDQIKRQMMNIESLKFKIPDKDQLCFLRVIRKWKIFQNFWNKQKKQLCERTRLLSSNPQFILTSAISPPWRRTFLSNYLPYYINDERMLTSWDHPELVKLMESICSLNDVRFSAYRTALKLKRFRKSLSFNLISLKLLKNVFTQCEWFDFQPNTMIDVPNLIQLLLNLYNKLESKHGSDVDVPLSTDLCLNFLLNIYDPKRTGQLKSLQVLITLSCLCKANLQDIYKFILCKVESVSVGSISKSQLESILESFMRIPLQINESRAFGGCNPASSVRDCFEMFGDKPHIQAAEFIDWMLLEPKSLSWLPVLHRLIVTKDLQHPSRCSVCRNSPVVGLLYRCLSRFNHDICQKCFYSSLIASKHQFHYPIVEYSSVVSSTENIRDLAKIVRNKLRGSSRKKSLPREHTSSNLNYLDASDIHTLIQACTTRLAEIETSDRQLSSTVIHTSIQGDSTPHSAVFDHHQVHQAPVDATSEISRIPAPLFETYDNISMNNLQKNSSFYTNQSATCTGPQSSDSTTSKPSSSFCGQNEACGSVLETSPVGQESDVSGDQANLPSASFYINQLISSRGTSL